ncbi:MAG: ATPase central domain protein [Myxococcales bacterium]|nr:ATPase central domain protein [Myxococcales bacterium]
MHLATDAQAELTARTSWTLARLGELINTGRGTGWLNGEPMSNVADADEILARADAVVATPMRTLATQLSLSSVEIDVLWLLACIELAPALAAAARSLVSPGMHELSAQVVEQLALRSGPVDGDMFERLAQLGLIETTIDPRVPLFRRPVRSSDRVIDLARGRFGLDAELRGVATLSSAVECRRSTASLSITTPRELSRALAKPDVLVVASGIEGSGRATLLRHVVSSSGSPVLSIRCTGLAAEHEGFLRQLRAIVRECRLHGATPLLLELDRLADRADAVERELLRGYPGPILATSRDSWTAPTSRALVSIPVALPAEAQRSALWRAALPDSTDELVDECARRYAISPGMVMRTANAATAAARANGSVSVEQVHTALRAQLERRLLGLAHRIEVKQSWDDLVLPVDQFDLLIELVARVRHRQQVLETWGFADKVGKGLGLSALLSGPPGTGKTMIAGLVARELGLDLYQVDLSRVVSKYIGETEKQLAALFEAAESGHAILLFDEADSLFGKRTEVKSSNDHHANLQVNYLLQRMESFNGISILTTNHETAIDAAFQRRLAFHVRVPMPDEEQRALLWTTMIPERAEREAALDMAELAAEFVMSGGYIKNAVLRAAYLAAHEGTPIGRLHLWRSASAEYESMGKVAYRTPA